MFMTFQMGKRDKAEVHYITSLGAVFGIKKYAEALMKVVNERLVPHISNDIINI